MWRNQLFFLRLLLICELLSPSSGQSWDYTVAVSTALLLIHVAKTCSLLSTQHEDFQCDPLILARRIVCSGKRVTVTLCKLVNNVPFVYKQGTRFRVRLHECGFLSSILDHCLLCKWWLVRNRYNFHIMKQKLISEACSVVKAPLTGNNATFNSDS